MDFSKLRLGELVAGAAGVLLLIVMFLPWYGVAGLGGGLSQALGSSGFDTTLSAWESLSVLRLLLLLTVIAAIAGAVLAMTQRSVALPVAASVIITALGLLAALLVLFRLVNEPGPDELFDIRFGAYLGFLLTAAIALGGFMSMRDEGASFSQAANDLQSRGAGGSPAGDDIPTQPAPPAGTPGPGSPPGQPTAPPPTAPPGTPGGQAPPPSPPSGQPPAGT